MEKVLVVKIQKPTGFSTSQQPCCSLELKLDGTYVRWPDVTPTEAANGSKPLVWMMEDKGSTTSTFAVTAGYSQDRTGWKATHKMENTSGQSVAIMNENTNIARESTNSQLSTPKGKRTIIITGDVKGIILIQNANPPSGFSIMGCMSINERINGIVIGNINCCVSASASTADPIAANNALYIK